MGRDFEGQEEETDKNPRIDLLLENVEKLDDLGTESPESNDLVLHDGGWT